MSDNNQVWFLTGTSSNFGITLTRALLKAGHRVVATARTPSKLPFVTGDRLLVLRLDVNDVPSISQAFDEAKKRFGRIDVLVNKAGSNMLVELEGHSEIHARDMFGTQFWGPAHVQKKATAIIEAQRSQGLIFNVTTVMAVFAAPLSTIMCASKAASESLSISRASSSPFVTAVNVRPGGFEDQPVAVIGEQLPSYAAKDLGRTVAATIRSYANKPPPGIGNVRKMAETLIALAKLPRDKLPIRAVVLGSDVSSITRAVATKRVAHIKHGQHLLSQVQRSGPRFKEARVWFVANANSTLGQNLVQVLLASGQRVAVALPSDGTLSPLASHDQLLVVHSPRVNVDALGTVLNSVAEHFGRVDVILNAPSDRQESQQDDWETAYAIAERVFWSPMNTMSVALKVLRERNPPGAGGRIFNILTTVSTEDSSVAVHNALNAAVNIGTAALARELPGRWNIGVAAVTLDSDLHADPETARTLIALAELSQSDLRARSLLERALWRALSARHRLNCPTLARSKQCCAR
ncbi:NAD(P)-binding protein [Peniophora sp. CONT]|nr:NAD(P)-binding protein [Peniophora sp. CONT]